MDSYHLYTVVPYLVKFVDQLTNIYVRYNRKRLKGKLGDADTLTALCTLYSTLLTLCKVRPTVLLPSFLPHLHSPSLVSYRGRKPPGMLLAALCCMLFLTLASSMQIVGHPAAAAWHESPGLQRWHSRNTGLISLQVMSPFTPFLTEHMYQNLRRCQGGNTAQDKDSVHFCDIPAATQPSPADQHIQQVGCRVQAGVPRL